MYNFDNSSAKKRNSYNETNTYLPTAEKSQYRDHTQDFERTPNKMEFTSPTKKSQRLSDAKRSINEVIEMISEKKKLNEEAISEVRQVNHEIIGSLSSFNPAKLNSFEQRNKTAQQFKKDNSKDYVTTSQFQWRPSNNIHYENQELKKSQHDSAISHQNIDLRARLNEEIKKNNNLLRYITKLQAQNTALRTSSQQSSGHGQNISSLIEQNRQLRSQLTGSTHVGPQEIPSNIWQELQRLKEQNNSLRRDTVNLLKRNPY